MPRKSLPEPLGRTLEEAARSWKLALSDEHKSPRTIKLYMAEATKFMAAVTPTRPVAQVSAELIRMYMARLEAKGLADTTRSISFRSLQAWFTWLVEEDELAASPFTRLHPPRISDEKIKSFKVPTQDELDRVLAHIAKDDRKDLRARDTAILLLLMDTGVRLGELAGMQLDDIDLDQRMAHVTGKTGFRAVRFSPRAARALDRYLVFRSRHFAHSDRALWLARAGKMSDSGLYQVVRDRGRDVGVALHPHQLRHLFASRWLAADGKEGDLQFLAGWKSNAMVRRYAAHDQAERAMAAYDRVLGDK